MYVEDEINVLYGIIGPNSLLDPMNVLCFSRYSFASKVALCGRTTGYHSQNFSVSCFM
jgi:hypothetical protein